MKTIKTTVYSLDELTDTAKEQARNWYREGALDYEWWDVTFEDAECIGLKITGFDLDRNKHATGHFTDTAGGVAARVVADHGKSCGTYRDAQNYLKDRAALPIPEGEEEPDTTDLDEEFERTLLEDYANLLQQECEYLLSKESVDESIRANEYTFTADGKRFG